jgi:hypothetical protein
MNLMYCNTATILLQSLSKIQKYREVKRAPSGAKGPVNSLTVDRQGIDASPLKRATGVIDLTPVALIIFYAQIFFIINNDGLLISGK